MKLSEELAWRGFVNQTTYGSPDALDTASLTFYWGVDPSAPSMTIGNLAAAMMVQHFIDHGHKAILLIGGATGMIGDPDGKSEERDLKSVEEIERNKTAIVEQYRTLFAGKDFRIVDNYDWFKDMGYLQFLRDVGKHVPVRQMVSRDFVQSRLGADGSGISYAEFSYSLIQGYDFLHLFKNEGVTLQVAASDQWGNSIAGVELIRRITGQEAHVWTAPLVINKATGKKFGKSEDGAIWLDPTLTSVYKFYQFWLNIDDEGAEDYLKIYTLFDKETVEDIVESHRKEPHLRIAQTNLADHVTALVHGDDAMATAKFATEVVFQNRPIDTVSEAEIRVLQAELPGINVNEGDSLIPALVSGGLATSNTEARRFLEAGAIYLNGKQIPQGTGDFRLKKEPGYPMSVVRRGKNTAMLLEIK